MGDYDHSDHLDMMRDTTRVEAYRAALQQTVSPGARVLDLGAGAGMMCFLALEAGAEHVVAIDPSANIDVLRRIARQSGLSERVTVIRADSRTVTLDNPVDVLVADLRGNLPLLGDGLSVVADAVQRHLRPGGTVIPQQDSIFVAPIESPAAYRRVDGWRRKIGPADYTPMADIAASEWGATGLEPSMLLAGALGMEPIVYKILDRDRLDFAATYTADRSGICHGLGAWFESELGPGIAMSTGPGRSDTVYGHAYFPLSAARPLRAGETIRVELHVRQAKTAPIWSWTIQVGTAREERHCSFGLQLADRAELERRGHDHVPQLNESGEINCLILLRMRESVRLGVIAEEIHTRFPQRFPELAEAMAYVGQLSANFSR